jgi:hypothetical protein
MSEQEVLPADEVKEKVLPEKEKEEDLEDLKKRSRKPPSGGKCIRCDKNVPINRLKLCYPCWVKEENEKSGWKDGQPHPPTCGCDLDCAQDRNSFGN